MALMGASLATMEIGGMNIDIDGIEAELFCGVTEEQSVQPFTWKNEFTANLTNAEIDREAFERLMWSQGLPYFHRQTVRKKKSKVKSKRKATKRSRKGNQ